MPLRHQHLLVAILGWFTIAAAAPGATNHNQSALLKDQKKPTAAGPKDPKKPDQVASERPPIVCGPSLYKSNDDLCAQWKAADSARLSAKWSEWSLYVGIAGTIGLLANLYYARKAVISAEKANNDAASALKIAQRNADSAQSQVDVARQTAERQLRAYVYLESADMKITPRFDHEGGGHDVTFVLKLKNFGQTPAKNVQLSAIYSYDTYPPGLNKPEPEPIQTIDIAAGGELFNMHTIPFGRDVLKNVENESHALYVYAVVKYLDVFDMPRETNFNIFVNGKNPQQRPMKPLDSGNSVT